MLRPWFCLLTVAWGLDTPQLAQDAGTCVVQTDTVFSFSPDSGKAASEEVGEGSGHSTQAPKARGVGRG